VERKTSWRKQIAALSFSEKIKILEKLRERSIAIASSGLRQHNAASSTRYDSQQQQ